MIHPKRVSSQADSLPRIGEMRLNKSAPSTPRGKNLCLREMPDAQILPEGGARIAQGGVRKGGRNPGLTPPPTSTAPEGRSIQSTTVAVGYLLTWRTLIVPRYFIVSSRQTSVAGLSLRMFNRDCGLTWEGLRENTI
jgi:hypothetical protein